MNKGKNKFAYSILFVGMTLMLCLRYGQGTDYIAYEWHYVQTPDEFDFDFIFSHDNFEFGFAFLLNAAKVLGISFEWFVGILSAFIMLMLNRFIKRYSENFFMSLLLFYPTFFLTYYFSAIRQGLALALFLGFLIPLAVEEKWWRYIFVCLLASTFHTSALLLLAIPLIFKFTLRDFVLLAVFAVVFAIFMKIPGFYERVISTFDKATYADIGMSGLSLLRKALEVLLVFMIGGRKLEEDSVFSKMLKIYCFGLIITIMFVNQSLVCSRLSVYFETTVIVLLPKLLKDFRETKVQNGKSIRVDAMFEKDRILKFLMFIFVMIALNGFMTVKNISSYIFQGEYFNDSISDYPYISVYEKDDIYRYRKNTFQLYN